MTACQRKVWCPAHPVWAKAQAALLRVLESVRVEELAEQGAVNQFTTVVGAYIAPAMTGPTD